MNNTNNNKNNKNIDIKKITNNIISNIKYDKLQFAFSDEYQNNIVSVYYNNKLLLVGEYEILGYYYNNEWLWACDNNYIEKYLTNKSEYLKKNINFTDLDDNFFNLCINKSIVIWIFNNNNEYILLNNIIQVI